MFQQDNCFDMLYQGIYIISFIFMFIVERIGGVSYRSMFCLLVINVFSLYDWLVDRIMVGIVW